MQHDWAMEDKPNALLRFRGAERCVVENCLFAESGQHAIRVDYHGQNIRIANNEIHNLGSDQHFYYHLDPNHTGPFKAATIDRNVYYNAEADSTTADNALLQQLGADGHDRNSRYADPGFIDWRNGDFRFQEGSPAQEIQVIGVLPRLQSRYRT